MAEELRPCIKLTLGDGGPEWEVRAFIWKSDVHTRVRFDVCTTEGAVVNTNCDATDVLGLLCAHILRVLESMVPQDSGKGVQ